MKDLLNLFADVALLVWGTQLVRTGVLRAFGSNLRQVLAHSMGNRFTAALSGIGVTALLQSSTATSLMTSSFVGQGLITLPAALAVMRGADIGTALMVVLFSFDLSWLSPLFIFTGVVLFLTRQDTLAGRIGRVVIGLGLILLALQLIMVSAAPLLATPAVRALLGSVGSDLLTEIILGMLLAVMAYSSLAVVLLIAALAASSMISLDAALGLVLGANLGSGLAAVLTTAKSAVEVRQVSVGNLVFKMLGVALMAPCVGLWLRHVQPLLPGPTHGVVLFHLGFNVIMSVAFIGLTQPVARLVARLLPKKPDTSASQMRPRHLDPSALPMPSLAISCAAREALHQADVVETMMNGMLTVIKTNDLRLAQELRKMDDTVDELYTAIKYYMTKIPREALDEEESRRWTDIISFTINMEQVGDIVERVLIDVEDKKIKPGRSFSEAGMAEITELHARLVDNLRLGMSVFLNGNVHDAQRLIEEKMRFRDLERRYATAHLDRLSENSVLSIETSSLHIDLISDLKRINSHICSIAYPILDSAGALAPNRLKTAALGQDNRRS
ncbi:Na/Pi cotransporter family protein [Rhodoferax sediminis]|jgi:phosphate:Na+ symporter|uniref:Na/Pi cotransporter family protein n=1 Tax=Rhodoferax sediminis TaxID=2509614 RepID=A0A515D8T4_9BURK|nr:Na/Pi cotransporter family protein [Rhodoferax sediminis]QDL36820.1 Na/Pi cotransporter family protein [Rhodoferax sediminis]